ncbi:MAG: ring-opening amidohydrolase [Lautropia sp.]
MSRVQCVGVHRIACRDPADLGGVRAMVEAGAIDPAEIVAVLGKTEGNGCVNDFTRDLAAHAWCTYLAGCLGCSPQAVEARVALVMSGGTEGVLSPHFTVFTRRWVDAGLPGPAGDDLAGDPPTKRLVVGISRTRPLLPEELGRRAQIDATAGAVRDAMRDAGIDTCADVHFVQVKCPLLTIERIAAARARATDTVTRDVYASMAWSRAASSLGVALALDEVGGLAADALERAVMRDFTLHSNRASASAGIELDANVVVVFGEARGARSPYRIAHTVMRDAIDAASVRRLLATAFDLDPDEARDAVRRRLVNLFAKAEADPGGTVAGARHTMLDDSDIHATRHARAAAGAVLASVVGDTALYVSGGAEHQGPPGGGPVAMVLRTAPR